jgi:hypothetical protein
MASAAQTLEDARDGSSDIGIIVRHPAMGSLPDMTVIALLLDLRSVAEDLHFLEFRWMINEWAIERPDDDVYEEVRNVVRRLPTFYIERLERGSLTALLMLAVPVFLWVLDKTVGSSIEKAYEGSKLDLWLQHVLKRGVASGSIPEAIAQYVDHIRPQRVSQALAEMLKDRGHLGGFPIDEIRTTTLELLIQLGTGSASPVALGKIRLSSHLDRIPA